MDLETDLLDTYSDEAVNSDITNLLCDPCLEDGDSNIAEGYCVDCSEYLCEKCFRHHRTPRPFRKHQLLDKQNMPNSKPRKVSKDECTEPCEIHEDMILEFFCQNHGQFACKLCVAYGHNACFVAYIPEISKTVFESNEFKSFKLCIDSLLNESINIENVSIQNLDRLKSNCDETIWAVRSFRGEINAYFEKIESKMIETIFRIQNEDREKIGEILEHSKILSERIKSVQNKIVEYIDENQKCRAFAEMKRILTSLEQDKDDIIDLEKKNVIRPVQFEQSSKLRRLLAKETPSMGLLFNLQQVLRSTTDGSGEGLINGIAVLNEQRICVTDRYRKRLSLIDTEAETVIATKVLAYMPWQLTMVSENEVALLQLNAVEIFKMTGKITLTKTIENAGFGNRALVYTKNRFIGFTASTPPKIRIIDTGFETSTLKMDKGVNFEDPDYMTVNSDGTRVYVSDFGIKHVVCLTVGGKLVARYKLSFDWSPRGIAMSCDERVFVCDNLHENIHILTSELKDVCLIRGYKYGITNPEGLAFCERENKLYVGMWDSENVVVLNVF